MNYLFTLSGLVAGNYIYQMAGQQHFAVALDRSVFQAVAIACVWIGSLR